MRGPIQVLLGAWLLVVTQAPSSSPIGFVLSARGPWELNGRPVRQGEAVPRSGRLVLASGAKLAANETFSIDVVLLNSAGLSLRCPTIERCRQGLTLPASLTGEVPLIDRLSEVFRLIFERPERFVGLMSRDPSAGAGVADGVARLDQGQASLAPFLQDLPPGTYRLSAARVSETSAAAPLVADLAWDRTPASAIPRTTFGAGLYRMTVTRPRDAAFGTREAWILLAPPERYDAAAKSFASLTAAMAGWDRDVPPADLAIFRHAALARLAASAP